MSRRDFFSPHIHGTSPKQSRTTSASRAAATASARRAASFFVGGV